MTNVMEKVRPKGKAVSPNLLRVMEHNRGCTVQADKNPLQHQLDKELILLVCPSCEEGSLRLLSKDAAEVMGMISHRLGCRASAPPKVGTANGRKCWECQDCGGKATRDPLTEISFE